MAFNGTVPNVLNELYPGLSDLSSLNWFEQQWVAWYVWIGNPIIATGLMSFLMHEVCCRRLFLCRVRQLYVRLRTNSDASPSISCATWNS